MQNFIPRSRLMGILLPCTFWFIGCHVDSRNYVQPEYDTTKARLAREDTAFNVVRLMLRDRIKPNGYFFGNRAVMPSGNILDDTLVVLPEYGKDRSFYIYQRYIENDTIKTDTFKIAYGPGPDLDRRRQREMSSE